MTAEGDSPSNEDMKKPLRMFVLIVLLVIFFLLVLFPIVTSMLSKLKVGS